MIKNKQEKARTLELIEVLKVEIEKIKALSDIDEISKEYILSSNENFLEGLIKEVNEYNKNNDN